MVSERETKNRNEGEKYEEKAFNVLTIFIKTVGVNAIVEKSDIKKCDYFVIFPNGERIPVEIKKVNEIINHRFYNVDMAKRYKYKRMGFVKLIKENHEWLKSNHGFYLIFIKNKTEKKLIISAKTMDKLIHHDDDDKYKRYYSVSIKKLLNYYELFKVSR